MKSERMEKDAYGAVLREHMKASMAEPVGPRPMVKESLWDEFSPWLGAFLWSIVICLVCALAWIGLSRAEGLFR